MTDPVIAADIASLAVPLDRLRTMPGNPRRGDVEAVMRSYTQFGQRKPITAQRDGTVTAGNHQLEAARMLGWTHIAVVWTDDDDVTATAWALADNRTADLGTYDNAGLVAMIERVRGHGDLMAAIAYSDEAIREITRAAAAERPRDPDPDPDPPEPPADPLTQPGDVWLLGPHRIICGDCRNPDDVTRLIGDTLVNIAFTSPPYADRRDYDGTSPFRPVPPDEYVPWFAPVAGNVAAHLADDGSWFVNIKPTAENLDTHLYVHDLVAAHVRQWGWHFATEYCWERGGMPKSPVLRFKNQFEPIYQFARGRWKFRPDNVVHASSAAIRPGGPGIGNTNWADSASGFTQQGEAGGDWFKARVIEGTAYPGNRLPTFRGSHEATGHTAAFPVGLPEFFVLAYTDPGDTIYDPFMGSGSTLLAADKTGRTAYGCELSPMYVDVTLARFQHHTGIKPILEATGDPHDFAESMDTE